MCFMMNVNDADAEMLRSYRTAYAVLGAECHLGLSAYYALPAIVALSVTYIRSGVARYRIATLADGSTALAARGARGEYSIAITQRRAESFLEKCEAS
jgi:hypothetical protein